jgi:hypothetical protein
LIIKDIGKIESNNTLNIPISITNSSSKLINIELKLKAVNKRINSIYRKIIILKRRNSNKELLKLYKNKNNKWLNGEFKINTQGKFKYPKLIYLDQAKQSKESSKLENKWIDYYTKSYNERYEAYWNKVNASKTISYRLNHLKVKSLTFERKLKVFNTIRDRYIKIKDNKIETKLTLPFYNFPYTNLKSLMPNIFHHWQTSQFSFNKKLKNLWSIDLLYTKKILNTFFAVKNINILNYWNLERINELFLINSKTKFASKFKSFIRVTTSRTSSLYHDLSIIPKHVLKFKWFKESTNIVSNIKKAIFKRDNEILTYHVFSGFFLSYFKRSYLSIPRFKHTVTNVIIDLFIYNNKQFKWLKYSNLITRRGLYKYMYSMYANYSHKIEETLNRPRFFYLNLIYPNIAVHYSKIIKLYGEILIKKNKVNVLTVILLLLKNNNIFNSNSKLNTNYFNNYFNNYKGGIYYSDKNTQKFKEPEVVTQRIKSPNIRYVVKDIKDYIKDLERKSNLIFDENKLTLWSNKGLVIKDFYEDKVRTKKFGPKKYSLTSFKEKNFFSKNKRSISPELVREKLITYNEYGKNRKNKEIPPNMKFFINSKGNPIPLHLIKDKLIKQAKATILNRKKEGLSTNFNLNNNYLYPSSKSLNTVIKKNISNININNNNNSFKDNNFINNGLNKINDIMNNFSSDEFNDSYTTTLKSSFIPIDIKTAISQYTRFKNYMHAKPNDVNDENIYNITAEEVEIYNKEFWSISNSLKYNKNYNYFIQHNHKYNNKKRKYNNKKRKYNNNIKKYISINNNNNSANLRNNNNVNINIEKKNNNTNISIIKIKKNNNTNLNIFVKDIPNVNIPNEKIINLSKINNIKRPNKKNIKEPKIINKNISNESKAVINKKDIIITNSKIQLDIINKEVINNNNINTIENNTNNTIKENKDNIINHNENTNTIKDNKDNIINHKENIINHNKENIINHNKENINNNNINYKENNNINKQKQNNNNNKENIINKHSNNINIEKSNNNNINNNKSNQHNNWNKQNNNKHKNNNKQNNNKHKNYNNNNNNINNNNNNISNTNNNNINTINKNKNKQNNKGNTHNNNISNTNNKNKQNNKDNTHNNNISNTNNKNKNYKNNSNINKNINNSNTNKNINNIDNNNNNTNINNINTNNNNNKNKQNINNINNNNNNNNNSKPYNNNKGNTHNNNINNTGYNNNKNNNNNKDNNNKNNNNNKDNNTNYKYKDNTNNNNNKNSKPYNNKDNNTKYKDNNNNNNDNKNKNKDNKDNNSNNNDNKNKNNYKDNKFNRENKKYEKENRNNMQNNKRNKNNSFDNRGNLRESIDPNIKKEYHSIAYIHDISKNSSKKKAKKHLNIIIKKNKKSGIKLKNKSIKSKSELKIKIKFNDLEYKKRKRDIREILNIRSEVKQNNSKKKWDFVDKSLFKVLNKLFNKSNNVGLRWENMYDNGIRDISSKGYWYSIYYLSYLRREYNKISKDIIVSREINYNQISINKQNKVNELGEYINSDLGDVRMNIYMYKDYNKRGRLYNDKLFKPYFRYMLELYIYKKYSWLSSKILCWLDLLYMIPISIRRVLNNSLLFDYSIVSTVFNLMRYNYRSMLRGSVRAELYFIDKIRYYKSEFHNKSILTYISSMVYIKKREKAPGFFWWLYDKKVGNHLNRVKYYGKLSQKAQVLLPFTFYFEDILYSIYGKLGLVRLWPLKKKVLSSSILAQVISEVTNTDSPGNKNTNYEGTFKNILNRIQGYIKYSNNENKKWYKEKEIQPWPEELIIQEGIYKFLKFNKYNDKLSQMEYLNSYQNVTNLFTNYWNYSEINNNLINNMNTIEWDNNFSIGELISIPLRRYIGYIKSNSDIVAYRSSIKGRTPKPGKAIRAEYYMEEYGNLSMPCFENKKYKVQSHSLHRHRATFYSDRSYASHSFLNRNGILNLRLWLYSRLTFDIRDMLYYLSSIRGLYSNVINKEYEIQNFPIESKLPFLSPYMLNIFKKHSENIELID